MKNGAQPTESVAQVFKTVGMLDRFERFKKGEAVETLVAGRRRGYCQARSQEGK